MSKQIWEILRFSKSVQACSLDLAYNKNGLNCIWGANLQFGLLQLSNRTQTHAWLHSCTYTTDILSSRFVIVMIYRITLWNTDVSVAWCIRVIITGNRISPSADDKFWCFVIHLQTAMSKTQNDYGYIVSWVGTTSVSSSVTLYFACLKHPLACCSCYMTISYSSLLYNTSRLPPVLQERMQI